MTDGLPPGIFPQALPPQFDAALRAQLLPGERVQWSAQPRPGKQWLVFLIWLFAVPWTAFALFWNLVLAGSLLSFIRISPDWQIGAQGAILILVLALRTAVNRLEVRPV